MKKHTFAICAYKESPYLEKCILSLKKQEDTSDIIMTTSTDNEHIRSLSAKYDIQLFINDGVSSITKDWNFALSQVKTKYATIAHQDDIYSKDYAKSVLEALDESPKPLIAFTDYFEIKGNERIKVNAMLTIKRVLLLPMRIRSAGRNKLIRRRCLSLGDPICCPSVTFCMENIPQPLFQHHYRSGEDWEAWELLSRLDGEFVYINKMLMGHRIHEESETSKIIADGQRVQENYEMFCKFWPKPIAKTINRFYTKSEDLNKV